MSRGPRFVRLRTALAQWRKWRANLLQPDLSCEVFVTVDRAGGIRVFWTKISLEHDVANVCNILMVGAQALAAQHGLVMVHDPAARQPVPTATFQGTKP